MTVRPMAAATPTPLSVSSGAQAQSAQYTRLYLDSLRAIGIDPLVHDIRFVELGRQRWRGPCGIWRRLLPASRWYRVLPVTGEYLRS